MAEDQAREMIGVFVSVGVKSFSLTYLTLDNKPAAGGYTPDLGSHADWIPSTLQKAQEQQLSPVIRPRPGGAMLIQLDDLDSTKVELVRPVSFLIVCTSPGNFQAWVAVRDGDKGFKRRLKEELGADPTASEAVRLSGSINFKRKYAPDFPRVETIHLCPGRIVKRADLEALKLVTSQNRPGPASSSLPVSKPDFAPISGGSDLWFVPPDLLPKTKQAARIFLKRRPGAVQRDLGGHPEQRGGDDHTFRTILILCNGYALPFEDAWPLLLEWNKKCKPPWDEEGLKRKWTYAVESARENIKRRGDKLPWSVQEEMRKRLRGGRGCLVQKGILSF